MENRRAVVAADANTYFWMGEAAEVESVAAAGVAAGAGAGLAGAAVVVVVAVDSPALTVANSSAVAAVCTMETFEIAASKEL